MNRNITIDIAKGLCIVLMIFGHCPGFPPLFYNGIESFHMPLFFIVSGLFYKPQDSSILLRTNFRRLIIPLLVGVAVCALVCFLMQNDVSAINYIKGVLFPGGTRRKDILISAWPSTGVYWFLAALFWCKVIYNQIEKHFSNYILLLSFVISWSVGTIAHRLMLPFGISEGCSALVFYSIGHQAQKRNIMQKSPPIFYPLFIVLWCIEINYIQFGMYECSWSPLVFPLAVIFAAGMSYVVYKVSDSVKKNVIGLFFKDIGLYSLEVMCCHEVVRAIVRNLQKLGLLNDNSQMVFLTIVIGTFVLATLYVKIKLYLKKENI